MQAGPRMKVTLKSQRELAAACTLLGLRASSHEALPHLHSPALGVATSPHPPTGCSDAPQLRHGLWPEKCWCQAEVSRMLLTASAPQDQTLGLSFTWPLPWGPPRCQALTIPAHLRSETGSTQEETGPQRRILPEATESVMPGPSPIARFRVGVPLAA